jgi:drug/metabolite transporter (DMT)-like permease
LASVIWLVPFSVLLARKKVDLKIFKRAIVPSIANILAQVFWAWAPYHLTPGLQMFFGQTSILFGIAASFLLFPDELRLMRSKMFWSGIVICVVGFVGMNMLRGSFSATPTVPGVIIIMLHAIFVGMYGVAVRYYLSDVKPWISFAVICLYTSIGLFVLMLILGEPSRLLDMNAERMMYLCISAFVGITFAHVFYYHAVIHIGVSITGGCKLIMPLLTAAGSYYFFGEIFSTAQWLSGFLILAGVGVLMYSQQYLGKRKP